MILRPSRVQRALPALALALLTACAPAAQKTAPPVSATTPVSQVSFYPYQAGLVWTYVPDGEAASSAPYVLRALGPQLFGSTEAQAFTLTGRGAEQTSYRLVSAAGVQLVGLRKPGLSVRLTPPWLEMPPESAWRVGYGWQGVSSVTVQSDDGKTNLSGSLTYKYQVLDRRPVTVAGQTYTVWVVNRQLTDTVGGLFPASQEEWFAPYVGDVRTPEALLLTARNFQGVGLGSAGPGNAGLGSAGQGGTR